MQVQKGYRLRNEIEGLFSSGQEPAAPKTAAELLQSHLIRGFEAALEEGMHPADALAVVLSWAALEASRIGDQNRE